MNPKLKQWLKTTLMATVGGGIAASVAALFDPEKYNIRHDFGSGKLWTFFLEGAGVAFLALLVKSPLGQQMIGSYRDSQAQLDQAKAQIAQMKKDENAKPQQPID